MQMKAITQNDLRMLKRYDETDYPTVYWYHTEISDNWEYVRWDDLIELFC